MVWLVVLVIAALALVATVADGRARLGRSRRPAPGEIWHTAAAADASPHPTTCTSSAAPVPPVPSAAPGLPAPCASFGPTAPSAPGSADTGDPAPAPGAGHAVLVLAVRTRKARVADLTAVPGSGTLPLPPGTTTFPQSAQSAQSAQSDQPAYVDPATCRDVPVTALRQRAGAVPREFVHRVDRAPR